MNKYKTLIELYCNNTPFCLVRFGDGEMNGIRGIDNMAYGKQHLTNSLQSKLKEALTYEEENYWIGKPCKNYPTARGKYNELVNPGYPYQTHATVLMNNHRWLNTFEWIFNNINNREVFWIGGEHQNLDIIRNKTEIEFIKVPQRNAWDVYPDIKDIQFPLNSIVLLSCGPLSRVLGKEYYENKNTVIGLGSVFDPITHDNWHRAHGPNAPLRCDECNYKSEDERVKSADSKEELIEYLKD